MSNCITLLICRRALRADTDEKRCIATEYLIHEYGRSYITSSNIFEHTKINRPKTATLGFSRYTNTIIMSEITTTTFLSSSSLHKRPHRNLYKTRQESPSNLKLYEDNVQVHQSVNGSREVSLRLFTLGNFRLSSLHISELT